MTKRNAYRACLTHAIENETYALTHLSERGKLLRKEYADYIYDHHSHQGDAYARDRRDEWYDNFNEFFKIYLEALTACDGDLDDKHAAAFHAVKYLDDYQDMSDIIWRALEEI